MIPETPTAGIFIPTMNRVDFVIRQLRYYASMQCPHTIYVGDSSPKEESERIKNEIEILGNSITVKYYYLPSYDDWQAHYHLITEVKEKYICYSGDDDYQVPNSITKCIEFLETHPDYTSASGYAVSFRLKQSGPYGTLERLADYPRQQIEDETGAERIMHFFNSYFVTHFSVNKTADLVNYWRNDLNIKDRPFKSEILPTALPLVYGKTKIIDCLGFVRQIHDKHYLLANTFDWIVSDSWLDSYKKFITSISLAISNKDNLPIKEAENYAKRGLWLYIQKQINKEYLQIFPQQQKQTKKIISLNGIRKKLPRLKWFYKRSLQTIFNKPIPVHYAVLQPHSTYYKDFKPILDSFTGKLIPLEKSHPQVAEAPRF